MPLSKECSAIVGLQGFFGFRGSSEFTGFRQLGLVRCRIGIRFRVCRFLEQKSYSFGVLGLVGWKREVTADEKASSISGHDSTCPN